MNTPQLAAACRWLAVLLCATLFPSLALAQAKATADDPIHVKMVEEPKPPKAEFMDLPTLLKFGLSVGAAAAFITPVDGGKGANQKGTAVAAMPYIALMPTYWFLGNVSKEYCMTRALTLNRSTAQEGANSTAMTIARQKYAADTKAGCTSEECKALNPNGAPYKSFDQVYRTATLKYSGWDVNYPGRCPASWLGVYFGIPLGYSTNFGTRKLDAKPKASFGLALAPTPYVNLLVGVTAVDAEIPATKDAMGMETAPAKFKGSWQLTFALGGTVDIFGKLFSLGK